MRTLDVKLTDDEAKIVSDNYDLIRWAIGKTHRSIVRVVGNDRVYDIAVYALSTAAKRFNAGRGKLATLFSWIYFREVSHAGRLGSLQAEARRRNVDRVAQPVGSDDDPAEIAERNEEERRVAAAFATLSDADRAVIDERHAGALFREMADREGVSIEAVRQRYLAAIDRLTRAYHATPAN